MIQDTEKTDVMFRFDTTKGFKGTIFAILPHECNNYKGNVTTYQHIGQHSGGDYQVCLQQSRPATTIEAMDLKAEMESLGYNINVVHRQNRAKFVQSYIDARK